MNDEELEQQGDEGLFITAHWPEACPHPLETRFLSVVAGNTTLHWALHHPVSYAPFCYWRTRINAIAPESDSLGLLNYLPEAALELFCDPHNIQDKLPSRDEVVAFMATKRIPAVSVYIISTNPGSERAVGDLFQGLACRLIRLRPTDFFPVLPYETIGIDRLAAAKAAERRPALIIDGGTAMTSTVVGVDGRIQGGGISPGLGAKFRALSEFTGKLPHISPETVLQRVEQCRVEPLPLFANTTQDAMMGSVLQETAVFVRSVVKSWLRTFVEPLGCLDDKSQNRDGDSKEASNEK